MPPRPLDHVVLPCRDLDEAAAHYTALGFTVGRRNRHPWGTENHIVQFADCFLELIAMAPGAVPPAPRDDAFPFAGFLAGRAGSPDPSAMIVLRADDAEADAAAFARDGIGEGRRLDFSRAATTPEGVSRTVSFSLAFATAPTMPDLGFFTCRQHAPEHFWDSALQRHANGVTGVAAVVIAAAEPARHAAFLSRFAGAPIEPREGGLAIALGNSQVEVTRGEGAGRLSSLRFQPAGATPDLACG